MKNNFCKFMCFVVAMFIGIISVNAASYYISDNCVSRADGTGIDCAPELVVEGDNVKLNRINLSFVMVGLTFDVKNTSLSSEWDLISNTSSSILIEKDTSNIPVGKYKIGTMKFDKITSASLCNLFYTPTFTLIDRTCKNENGKYYDKNGDVTTKINYEKQCLPHTCEKLSDGTFFGKDGSEVTEAQYKEQCESKKVCKVENGKYFNKAGEETTEVQYKRECQPNYCAILVDGDKSYYFDKNGKEVDKKSYEDSCLEKLMCVIKDGKYYDKDGKETTKINYEKNCQKNVCQILSDGTHYDKEGKVTDELNYKKQCEIHTCEILEDGTYYGKDGKEIDEATFNLTCKKHKCEVVSDKYFDDNGNMVTKEAYDKACTNPKTGNNLPYIVLAIGGFIGLVSLYISKKNKRFNNI